MRLLSLHIENFGRLSGFDYTFEDGLTVLQQANGFGKTTLAVFIKVMLYGFSGVKARGLDNERKRYFPWQGGRYGGSLVFLHEGTEYKVTRMFGKTAKNDTFSLYDLTNRRDSLRFSERLGEELFGIDAESFARTTYLPQLAVGGSLATASISARLSNLVDNTDDLNSYDDALSRLQEKRKHYLPQKGTGGTVNQLTTQIEQLERQRDTAEQAREPLRLLDDEIEALRREETQQNDVISALREKIRTAAQRESRLAKQAQYQALLEDFNKKQASCDRLAARRPAGCPTGAELEHQRSSLAAIDQSEKALGQLHLDPEDTALVAKWGERFADKGAVRQDIDRCAQEIPRLEALLAGQNTQESPDDAARLHNLTSRFAEGTPSEEEMQEAADRIRTLQELAGARSSLALSPEEEARLERLNAFFGDCPLDETEFAHRQDACRRAEELRRKRESQPAAPAARRSPAPLAAVLGLLLLAAGLACLAAARFSLGAVLAVVGFAALLGAFWLHTQQLLSRQQLAPGISAEELRELAGLENDLSAYLARWQLDTTQPAEALGQLRRSCDELQALARQQTDFAQRRQTLDRTAAEHNQALCAFFGTDAPADWQASLDRLRADLSDYRRLTAEAAERSQNREDDRRQAELLDCQLKSIWERYGLTEPGKPYAERLNELREALSAYRLAAQRVEQYQSSFQAHTDTLSDARTSLDEFLKKYRMEECPPAEALQQLGEDTLNAPRFAQERDEAKQKLDAFLAENPASEWAETEPTADTTLPDSTALMAAETVAQKKLDDLSAQLREKRLNRDALRRRVEELPPLQDKLCRLREERDAARQSAALLDRAAAYLEQAKQNLSNSYVGKVERSFADYAASFLGGVGAVSLKNELEVRVTEQGEEHELGCFSAGTADSVMLCMRLALIDALFTEEKPFIILDDPFVNLDDAHTARALDLLRRISAGRQVIYLVCNSSRR